MLLTYWNRLTLFNSNTLNLIMLWWLMKGCMGQWSAFVMLLFGLQNLCVEKSWKLVEISFATLF